jgi:DNA sulfur modification protein DndD
MKISKVELENFRVFYGRHEVNFSTEDARSVTVLIGENGGGKTSFLNAIYWAFTGKTTPRLEQPENLINKDAEREGGKSCVVEVTFSHESEFKVLRRETKKGGEGIVHFWSLNPKSGIRHTEDPESGINYL